MRALSSITVSVSLPARLFELLSPGFLLHHSIETAFMKVGSEQTQRSCHPCYLIGLVSGICAEWLVPSLKNIPFLTQEVGPALLELSLLRWPPFNVLCSPSSCICSANVRPPKTWSWVPFPSISLSPCDLLKFHAGLYYFLIELVGVSLVGKTIQAHVYNSVKRCLHTALFSMSLRGLR